MKSAFDRRSLIVFILCLTLFQGCSYSQSARTDTVCITRTGEKYHRCTCRYLRQSSYELSLKEATERGYTACSVCRPPRSGKEEENTIEVAGDEPASSSGSQKPLPSKKATPQKANDIPVKTSSVQQCSGYTKSGTRCKRTTTSASGKCWQHE